MAQLGFLVLLKTFQRLGYFVAVSEVSPGIVTHIANCAGLASAAPDLSGYDRSGTRWRHLQAIRKRLSVKPYDRTARRVILEAMKKAARTKDELADLINVAIEELIRQRWELPLFSTLQRAALHVRALVYRGYYREIARALGGDAVHQINALLKADPATRRSTWNDLKQNPGSASLGHFRDLVTHYQWLAPQGEGVRAALSGVPDVKVKQFAAEARTLDAARMQALEPQKRLALAVALLVTQSAQALDDLAEMFIKRMMRIHQRGKEALAEDRERQQERTDQLIGTLRDLVTAYRAEGAETERLTAIGAVLGERGAEVIEQCEAHQAFAGNNYCPFLWRFYVSHRATLFRLLSVLRLESTSQDQTLIEALAFLREHETSRGEWVTLEGGVTLDLSWAPDVWWRLITGEARRDLPPRRINRRHFEVRVFSQLMWELKSGDVCVVGSDGFADYRGQLISWEEYKQMVADFGEQVGLPVEGAAFIERTRSWLAEVAQKVDAAFPRNESVRIERGEAIISRAERKADPEELRPLERSIAERIESINILDVLADTERWLN